MELFLQFKMTKGMSKNFLFKSWLWLELTMSSRRESPGQSMEQSTGGRLRLFMKVWDKMKTSLEWSSVIRQGYNFRFQGKAPKLMKVESRWATKLSPSKMKVI